MSLFRFYLEGIYFPILQVMSKTKISKYPILQLMSLFRFYLEGIYFPILQVMSLFVNYLFI